MAAAAAGELELCFCAHKWHSRMHGKEQTGRSVCWRVQSRQALHHWRLQTALAREAATRAVALREGAGAALALRSLRRDRAHAVARARAVAAAAAALVAWRWAARLGRVKRVAAARTTVAGLERRVRAERQTALQRWRAAAWRERDAEELQRRWRAARKLQLVRLLIALAHRARSAQVPPARAAPIAPTHVACS